MKKIVATIFIVTTLFFIAACDHSTTKTAEVTDTKTNAIKKNEGISEVTLEQIKAVGIEMGQVQQMNLASVIKASGQLTVPPQNRAVVNALVGGVIRKINIVEGQQVSKGQVMVVIENPDFIRLQQDYLTSKDNIVYLKQEFERQKTLKESDAGIGKVYQQAAANFAAESSRLSTLEKQLQQIHISPSSVQRRRLITQVPVLAPITGTVGHIKLNVGAYTDASSPIMEIINNSIVYCDLQVYEKDIDKIRIGQKVKFILTNQDGKQVTGLVSGINKSFESENRSVIVHAVVNNVAALNLIAGQYISALIETGQQSVTAVSKDAIVKANDKSYIFIFEGIEKETVTKDKEGDEDNKKEFLEKYRFKMTEVVTGVEELGFVEIKLIEDLKKDIKIVTKGAFYLYSAMQNIETDDL